MFRIIRTSFSLLFIIILIIFCLGNRNLVNINFGFEILGSGGSSVFQLPLFIALLVALALGFVMGSFSEFLRGHKFRRDYRASAKSLVAVSNELDSLKREKNPHKEDLLSLLK